ncbi:MAG: mannosyltransferase family protein [Chloroflexota bacterium]
MEVLYSRWWTQCVLLWLSVFLWLNIFGMIGSYFLDPVEDPHAADLVDSSYTVPGIWFRWDAGHYYSIAAEGYAKHPEDAGFFPLYPLLVGFLSRATGTSIAIIGFLVSNVSLLISTLLFYRIARNIKDDHIFALRSVLAMLVFPTSFFYFALYAESLYLLFALVGTYLALEKRQFVTSGLALGISSLARPVGWLLDIVLVGEFVRRKEFSVKALVSLGLGVFLSGLGIVLYVYYLYRLLGTFLAIPEAQAAWPRHWAFPWDTYWQGLKIMATPSLIRENWFVYAMNVCDLMFTTFAAVVIVISFIWANRKEFPWSLAAYSTVAFLFFLSSQNELPSPLWGMTRWVASLFPMYFILGNIFKNRKYQVLYFIGSTLILIFFTAWWTSGRWIG